MNRWPAAASKASATTLCQKCLKRGHYSYECTASQQDRPYVSRPSRTQVLRDPKLAPRVNTGKETLKLQEMEATTDPGSQATDKSVARSLDISRRSRSSSSASVSTMSTNRSRSRSKENDRQRLSTDGDRVGRREYSGHRHRRRTRRRDESSSSSPQPSSRQSRRQQTHDRPRSRSRSPYRPSDKRAEAAHARVDRSLSPYSKRIGMSAKR